MKKLSSQSLLDDLDAQLYRAMVELQWIRPLSDETIEQDECEFEAAQQAGTIRLPKVLESPDVILARLQMHRTAPVSVRTEIQEQMARAAREGGAIPPEVEELMRRDRTKAEATLQKVKGDYEDFIG